MLKFFRKLRYQLIEKKKIRNYFKYAVGEIILVVIGILIALQINNWNHNRKTNEQIEATYAVIKEEISADTIKFNTVLKSYESERNYYERILDGTLTKTDLEQYNKRWIMTYHWYDCYLKNSGFEQLSTYSGQQFNINKASTNKKLEDYYYSWRSLEQNLDVVQFLVNTNFDYWQRNVPWFYTIGTQSVPDSAYNYVLYNREFKNEVLGYKTVVFDILVPNIYEQNRKAKEILKILDEN